MYYIIESYNVNTNENHTVEITTLPSKDVVYKNIRTITHGKFGSLNKARIEMHKIFTSLKSCDIDGNDFEIIDPNVVEMYRVGEYKLMSFSETYEYVYDCVVGEVESGVTDIKKSVSEFEQSANDIGYTLDSGIIIELFEQLKSDS